MKNKRMKIARIECDMNQEDLARAVGVTRQTIGMIESGNYNPTLNLCISICKALGKTLNELLIVLTNLWKNRLKVLRFKLHFEKWKCALK